MLLQFCKVCENAELDKDTVLKALDAVTEKIYGSDYDTYSAAWYFRRDAYELIEPVLSAQQDVELTNGNDTAEIQQKISAHPKECLHAILEDVAKQYTMAATAQDISEKTMENHLGEDLQAHQEALYEAALEQGLSHDDLEYAFGEDFVTEIETREQMQQAEKNNDDLNLE